MGPSYRIAVVDDEAGIRRALARLLHAAGMDVETFGSGRELLESVDDCVPDCIVLDIHMPGGSGFDVQAGLNERQIAIPVVVITAHDHPEAQARALAGGASAYLRKPVDGQALLDAVVQAIEKRR